MYPRDDKEALLTPAGLKLLYALLLHTIVLYIQERFIRNPVPIIKNWEGTRMEEKIKQKGRDKLTGNPDFDWADEKVLLASIVDSSDDAIIGKTLDGIIMSWNPGAEKIYGYSAKEVKGHSVSILIPEGYPGELPNILKKIKEGERIGHYEAMRKRRDGKKIDVSLTISPVKDKTGKIIGASTIARDITERKKMEAELKDKTQALETFHKLAVGREFKVIELKKQVNKLSKELGKEAPYDVPSGD